MPRYKLKPAGPDSLPAPPAAPSIMTGSIRPPGGSMMNGPVMQPPPLPPIPPGKLFYWFLNMSLEHAVNFCTCCFSISAPQILKRGHA